MNPNRSAVAPRGFRTNSSARTISKTPEPGSRKMVSATPTGKPQMSLSSTRSQSIQRESQSLTTLSKSSNGCGTRSISASASQKPDTAPLYVQRNRSTNTGNVEMSSKNGIELNSANADNQTVFQKRQTLTTKSDCDAGLQSVYDLVGACLSWPALTDELNSRLDGSTLERPYSHPLDDAASIVGVLACLRCRTPLFDVSIKGKTSGGFSCFDKGNMSALFVIVSCNEGLTRVIVRCKQCQSLIGELSNQPDDSSVIKCQFSSMHLVEGLCEFPETFSVPASVLMESRENEEQFDSVQRSSAVIHAAKNILLSKGVRSANNVPLEYGSGSESSSSADREPARRRPRSYEVEFFSDSDDDD